MHTEEVVHYADDPGVEKVVSGARWDIFLPDDRPKIVAFLKDKGSTSLENPIHSQKYYLSDGDLAELEAHYSVYASTFVQMAGECVFIPPGAPHQVNIFKFDSVQRADDL